jgi:hypothetical protein
MYHSGSGFAQDTLRAPAQEGNLAHPTFPGEAGEDGADVGTVGTAPEETHGVRAEVERVEDGTVLVDMHSALGAASRNHVGPNGHGSGSTRSRHPLPVAVRGRWELCLLARQRCWVLLGLPAVGDGNCYSQ